MEEKIAQNDAQDQIVVTKQMSTSKKIAFFSIFVALVIVMQVIATVGGKLFAVVVPTLALVPILLAIVTMGLWQGVALGGVFSTVVLIFTVSGYDAGSYTVFQYNPILTVLLIYAKGCVAPLVSALVYNSLKFKAPKASIWFASVLLPILNTGIFCLGMLLFYEGYLYSTFGVNVNVIYVVFVLMAGVNFLIELAANTILTPVVIDVKKIFDKGLF